MNDKGTHLFGDTLTKIRTRKQGISQSKIAQGIDVDPAIISKMCHGQLLTGLKTRERILDIICFLRNERVLEDLEEANKLLESACQARLREHAPEEARLIRSLNPSTENTDIGANTQGATSPQSHRPSLISRKNILTTMAIVALIVAGTISGALFSSKTGPSNTFPPTPPKNQWAIFSDHDDDFNIIVVNGHIVQAIPSQSKPGWTSIDKHIRKDGKPNYVAAVHLNGPHKGNSSLFVAYDDEASWKGENRTDIPGSINYWLLQIVDTKESKEVEELKETDLLETKKSRSNESWFVRITTADDVGLVMINGIPAAGAYKDYQFRPFPIGKWLYADEPNEISVMIWNKSDDSYWDISFWRNDDVLKLLNSENEQSSTDTGEVYHYSFVINEKGELVDDQN